jgi:hypothetical protein
MVDFLKENEKDNEKEGKKERKEDKKGKKIRFSLFKKVKKEKEKIVESYTPTGLEVTLLPEEIPITKRMIQERIFIFLAVIAFSSLLIFLSWAYCTWHIESAKNEIDQIKTELLTLDVQIKNLDPKVEEIKVLEKKATKITNLLNNHIYWTNFFDLLEKYTIPEVYYGDFNGSFGENITLPAVGKDLISVAKQIVAFSNAPFVKNVNVSNLTGGVKGVSFNLNLILDPNLFHKK